MKKNLHIVVVDPQNSFCSVVDPTQQQITHSGELCVPGAAEDMGRVAALVRRLGRCLTDIHITLESRHAMHISHPRWFRDLQGTPPPPFTVMRDESGKIIGSRFDESGREHQVGEYCCFKLSIQRRTIDYLNALQASGRYPHVIWPPHCLIGTVGHNVVPDLMQALLDWATQNDSVVDFITKGSNPFVEHFSAVRAEVVDPSDPSTQLNVGFIQTLEQADEVLFAGAGRHGLVNTVRDIANSFPSGDFIRRSVLLLDGMSPLAGFSHYQDQFLAEMADRGMKITTTLDYRS